MMATKYTIDGCPNDAAVSVQYAHPDRRLRWSANLCDECKHDVRPAGGELILGPIRRDGGQWAMSLDDMTGFIQRQASAVDAVLKGLSQ